MAFFKKLSLVFMALSALSLTACATTQQGKTELEDQKLAMQRWNECIDRNTDSKSITAVKISQLLNHSCEGHKRDVIDAFPPHMSKQIDQLLISRLYQLLSNQDDLSALDAVDAMLIKTALR